MKKYFVHKSSFVDKPCSIGEGTKIWHFSHIQKNTIIGKGCTIGQNVNISNDVIVGNGVKIQNNVSVYTGTLIEDNVFLGPSCVFTNVLKPRSQISKRGVYEKTIIKQGATIGANATILCGIVIGEYAFVGAGAVVTKNIPDYGLFVGNPAKRTGWMSKHGFKLIDPDKNGIMVCPASRLQYLQENPDKIRCLSVDENDWIPYSINKL